MANGFMFPDQEMSPFMQAMTSPGMAMAMEAANNFQRMAQGQQVTNPVARYQQMVMQRAQQNQAMRQAEQQRQMNELGMESTQLGMEKTRRSMNPLADFQDFVEQRGIGDLPYPEQLSAWREFQTAGLRQSSVPAEIQEFQFFQNLSEEDQKNYLNLLRAGRTVDLGGGGVGELSPAGELETVVTPEMATVRDAAAEREKAEQRAIGKSEGTKQAAATGDIKTSNKVIELIDMARNHPGREAATGMSSIANPAAMPGSQRRDFLTLHEQLTGNAFLMAYQQLKGGGPITDREGAVATQAQNRLNLAQTEEAYLQALDEMERDMQMLLEEAQARQEGAAEIVEEVEKVRTPTMRWDPQLRRVVPVGGD